VASHVGTALTPLVGRERELRAIESRLANGARLVTLTGPGGSGKTRLAREVFGRHRIQGASAYFVDLVGIGDPGLVPAEIATELGVTETADRDAAGAVVAALRDAAAVVVLDNLEELLGARDFLADLLRAAPELQLIATSRIPLGIRGEVEFQVPPLDLPHGDGPAEVEASPAGTLFLERARAVGRLDEVDAPTAKAIAELCRRLDGLPLALELAAARTRILPPAAILRHLVEHTSGLLAKVGEEDVRHESLDAVLSWSLDLLESNEAEVLGAVAICPGGFDLPMAEALAPDLNVLQALDVLATHGLLVQGGEIEGEPWYRLLETIRMAALQRAPQEATTTRWERLANHLSGRVAGANEAYYKIDEVAFRRLDALLDNVRAVLDWTEVNDPALNLSIAAQFWPYWRMRGRSREATPRLRAAIAANRGSSSDLARTLIGLAVLTKDSGGLPEARRAAAEGARVARIVGDPDREIIGLGELITSADVAMPEVSNRLRELLTTVEHPVSRYLCLVSLAWAEAHESGSGYDDAVILQLRDAEAALSGTPYRQLQGMAGGNLALIYLYRDRPIDAYEHSTRALFALGEAGPNLVVWIHSLRATAAAATGRFSEAMASLRSAFELADSVGAGLEVAAEMMVAAVAVLAVSDAPLLAAKAWGAMTAGDFSGSLLDYDRALAERLLVPARRATDPASFEVAIKAGQNAGVARVIDEVLAHLDVIAASPGQVRPDLGAATRLEVALRARELGIVDPTLDDS
jgi:Predicted ATPase